MKPQRVYHRNLRRYGTINENLKSHDTTSVYVDFDTNDSKFSDTFEVSKALLLYQLNGVQFIELCAKVAKDIKPSVVKR